MKLRSTSPSQSLHARSFSTIHAASPAGESVSPNGGGLGLGAVHGGVGALGRAPGRGALEPGALLGREVRRVAGEDGQARVGAVDGHDPVGVVEPEVAAHVAADVPARRAEPRVAEDAHELGPQAGDGDGVERRAGRAVGVPVARHVGHDHVERVGGVGAVRAGVGQQRDDLRVAPERVRPAVAQDQRQHGPGRRGGPGVHEVDREAAERDAEAGEPGERRLLRRPVEPVRPVGDELAEVGDVGPERPPGVLGRVRPARRAQPRAEVLERRGGGLRGERLGAGQSRRGRPACDASYGSAETVPF